MPVTHLTLERFGPFGRAQFPFTPGVNVLLGANSTGKTFAAKALYSVLSALGPEQERRPAASPRELTRDKLAAVFRPDDGDVRRLIRRTHRGTSGRIRITLDDGVVISVPISTRGASPGGTPSFRVPMPRATGGIKDSLPASVLFLPSREMLAMFEGFISSYQRRELAIDETYYDLAVALDAAALRGPRPKLLRDVVRRLETELGGSVRRRGPRFYLRSRQGGAFEAHLMAEGLRKVASVVHLIANGALRQGGVLIWDEPEANLHPRLAEVVVECLGALAEGGVQVIVCTHDYLIADAVSRWAQYRDVVRRTADVRFFQLLRDDDDAVRVDVADTFVDLPANPLLDAFLAHHDREQQLIARELAAGPRSRRRA